MTADLGCGLAEVQGGGGSLLGGIRGGGEPGEAGLGQLRHHLVLVRLGPRPLGGQGPCGACPSHQGHPGGGHMC